MQHGKSRAWVEVDAEAVAHNLAVVRQCCGVDQVMPVVKADAYGHGMECVARRLECEQPAFFAVASAAEAQRLERIGLRTPPFILGPTPPSERELVVQKGWGCIISTAAEAEHLASLGRLQGHAVSVHLALDTGMGREGFLPQELSETLPQLAALSAWLRVEGVMSHLAAADEDADFTGKQIAAFEACVQQVRDYGFPVRYVHLAASAGLLGYRVPSATMVRPGLVLYGVAPVPCRAGARLCPALRLVAEVTLVRDLPANHGISYGRTFITSRPTRIATIGIGYADGWNRRLSGSGIPVFIHGHPCATLGRVTMDQIMADVTALGDSVRAGDEAELIGPLAPVQQVAACAGTIPWDIFTGLGPRLPRIESRSAQAGDGG